MRREGRQNGLYPSSHCNRGSLIRGRYRIMMRDSMPSKRSPRTPHPPHQKEETKEMKSVSRLCNRAKLAQYFWRLSLL